MINFNFILFPALKAERLVLRQLEERDARLIFEYQSNKENFKYVDMPVYTSIKEAQNYIKRMNDGVKDNKWIIWTIADPVTNNILGTISIWNICKEQLKGELGYGLFPGSRGKGIMSQALEKVTNYGFNSVGLKTIEANTNAMNSKSRALLERSHFTEISSIMETDISGDQMEMDIYCRKNQD